MLNLKSLALFTVHFLIFFTNNNNIYRTSLSSLINNNEIYNNLYRNSLSGYVNVSVMNLNNRITTTNTLLQADFSTLAAIAYSAVASNFTNIIGALIEAYMILNLRSRVSTIENTYLKSSFL